MTSSVCITAALVVASCLVSTPTSVSAQAKPNQSDYAIPFTISPGISFGLARQPGRCISNGYWAPGVDVRSRGRVFLRATLEGMLQIGATEACAYLPSPTETSDDRHLLQGDHRMDIASGVHGNAGIGFRTPLLFGQPAEFDAAVGMGRGQEGFRDEWLPSVSLAGSVLLQRVVIGAERRWIRVPQWYTYVDREEWTSNPFFERPDNAQTRWNWSDYWAISVRMRF